jgi:hypothetical protein
VKAVTAFALVASTAACVHRSPEAAVIAAFNEASQTGFEGAHLDSAARGCTSPATKVQFIAKDTAVLKYFQDCAGCPGVPSCGTLRFETDYLILKKNGHWKVDKAVGGGVIQTS